MISLFSGNQVRTFFVKGFKNYSGTKGERQLILFSFVLRILKVRLQLKDGIKVYTKEKDSVFPYNSMNPKINKKSSLINNDWSYYIIQTNYKICKFSFEVIISFFYIHNYIIIMYEFNFYSCGSTISMP